MLLKGISEVQAAGRPLAAADMVLVRIAYAADLPTPDEIVRSLEGENVGRGATSGNGGSAATVSSAPTRNAAPPSAPRFETPRPRGALASLAMPADAPDARRSEQPDAAPALVVGRFEDVVALAAEKRDLAIKAALERDVRLVRCEDGRLEIAIEPGATKSLVGELSRKLAHWTGRRWMVVVSAEPGAPTVKAQNDARQAALTDSVRSDPLVQAVLTRFPGAEIVGVSRAGAPQDGSLADIADADRLPAADADDANMEPAIADDRSAFGAHGRPDDVDVSAVAAPGSER
jgi:DNA polymerase-3 subunit gamma/tau